VIDAAFAIIAKVTKLELQSIKCQAVFPVSLTDKLRCSIKCWLMEHCPALSDVTITNTGKYLGFLIGPDTKDQ